MAFYRDGIVFGIFGDVIGSFDVCREADIFSEVVRLNGTSIIELSTDESESKFLDIFCLDCLADSMFEIKYGCVGSGLKLQ